MQARCDVLGLVVDRGIEAELVLHVGALLRAARDADHLARPLDARDLPHRGAGRAGRGGHHDDLALLQAAHVEQPEVRGQAGDAEEAERGRGGDARGDRLQRALALVGDHVVLPADHPEQQLPGLVALAVACSAPPRSRPRGSPRRCRSAAGSRARRPSRYGSWGRSRGSARARAPRPRPAPAPRPAPRAPSAHRPSRRGALRAPGAGCSRSRFSPPAAAASAGTALDGCAPSLHLRSRPH